MQGDFVDEVRLRTPRETLNRFRPSPKTSDNPGFIGQTGALNRSQRVRKRLAVRETAGSTEHPDDRIPPALLPASTVPRDASDPHILIRSISSTVMSAAVRS